MDVSFGTIWEAIAGKQPDAVAISEPGRDYTYAEFEERSARLAAALTGAGVAPREAPTTRGFAGILHAGLDGMPADEVLATPAEFTGELGLAHLVSPLRLRGMAAMLARIKNQVREKRAGLTVSLPTLVLRQGDGQPSGKQKFGSVPLRFEPVPTSGPCPLWGGAIPEGAY